MYTCFKKNFVNLIKVSQLASFVNIESIYPHGEASLTTTIVNLAQNFVGSNNINLLIPDGQFGTRFLGGKDAAPSHDIYTKLR